MRASVTSQIFVLEMKPFFTSSLAIGLFTWSWISGYVLRSLSRRTTWLTAALFYVGVLNFFWIQLVIQGNLTIDPNVTLVRILIHHFVPYTSIGAIFLFMLPGYLGLNSARRQVELKLHRAVLLLLFMAGVTALLTWTSGFYEHGRASFGMYNAVPWQRRLLPLIFLNRPMLYFISTAKHARNNDFLPGQPSTTN